MKYEVAEATVVEFEDNDVIMDSNFFEQDEVCAQPSWDAEYCDGVTQAVSKGQFF